MIYREDSAGLSFLCLECSNMTRGNLLQTGFYILYTNKTIFFYKFRITLIPLYGFHKNINNNKENYIKNY